MNTRIQLLTGIVVAALSFPAIAEKPIVYPSKGQSKEQQSRDDGECYVWAKQTTGVDPAVQAQAKTTESTSSKQGGGERTRGALRGAVGGAIVGEVVNDDAGKGAATGAVLGTMSGSREARKRQASQQQAQAQQAQAQAQQMNTYQRAYNACMEGRGYTLK